MAVNLRKKYIGNKEVSKKNKAYRYQFVADDRRLPH